ncbi:MAG: hypothetical protein QM723_40670 [Myxococcaceae bacterium]
MNETFTLIVVPADPLAQVRRFQLRRRWVLQLLVAAACFAAIIAGLILRIVLLESRAVVSDASIGEVTNDLRLADEQMRASLAKADAVHSRLLRQFTEQQEELRLLRGRYDQLKELTEGKEQLARTYRSILNETTWRETVVSTSAAFLLGILSSLAASVFYSRLSARGVANEAEARAAQPATTAREEQSGPPE